MAQEPDTTTLEDVAKQYADFLDLRSANDAEVPLRQLRGKNVHRFHHKCSGYSREEITLTSNILSSAIITHAYPTPNEICLICGVVVSDAELFICHCVHGELEHIVVWVPLMVVP